MEATNRIIINTVVQYVRSFIYMLLMLFSTRFVLAALGQSAYGVYSVIGSVVFMIGFITQSLASSTQRFLSFSHGQGDVGVLRSIFANAFVLHIGFALGLVLFMACMEPVFMGFLNIPDSLHDASIFVYFMVLLMVLLTFVTAPIRALYIARENIIYVSVVEVLDAVFKLLGAMLLPYIHVDSLRLYSVLMFSVSVFNFFAYALYAIVRYDECHLPRVHEVSLTEMKKLTGFAVWNVYAVGSTVLRTQGVAVIINHFLGTLVNAAYGIALQVSNAVSFIAISILNAMNPQLMKAEGAGDRQRMLMLSTKESKYSFLVLSLLLIPLIVEMPSVLPFWLNDVPDHAVMFCRMILLDFIMDQLTVGLSSANQAIGRIRNYSILTSTIRLLCLPLAWLCLSAGYQPIAVMISYVAINAIIGCIRIPYLKVTAGLEVRNYLQEVVLCNAIPVAGLCAVACAFTSCCAFPFRFIVTECICVIVGIGLIYLFSLTIAERLWLKSKIRK